MKIKVLWVGKIREPWVREAVNEYAGRIRRYSPLEMVDIRDEKGAEAEEMRRRECERLEKQISPTATLILLDERGEQPDSPGLAAIIGRQRDNGCSEVVFAIGGAYGFSEEFRQRGKLLALSKLTFTHQMVRVFLLEQIYRAFTILNGEPYHH
ncbi:MAG TPA: 23S rRNA (pseudouridine(1915)-N(3))-methyltransferase RlmH [Desulfuromonadales bacterium]|nr:23S rRNA (pseudouridine(1915)-N(3))-methyltransferase RlmH [Desulfuromonadales bacterium]